MMLVFDNTYLNSKENTYKALPLQSSTMHPVLNEKQQAYHFTRVPCHPSAGGRRTLKIPIVAGGYALQSVTFLMHFCIAVTAWRFMDGGEFVKDSSRKVSLLGNIVSNLGCRCLIRYCILDVLMH
jgi:hypothetical protein